MKEPAKKRGETMLGQWNGVHWSQPLSLYQGEASKGFTSEGWRVMRTFREDPVLLTDAKNGPAASYTSRLRQQHHGKVQQSASRA